MPDLKKMLTLEALSAALPSWLKRDTKPEYNADEIDSANTTNQFVSASDKDNWNAKGTYSKPPGGIPKSDLSSIVQTSLEKADSALQSETDPTVPLWAKQTNKPSYTQDEVPDGTTYKRVTQTEKDAWSGKQNALTTTQMQAVNSGITSEGVAQISTNQTNVLYALETGANNGVKNIYTVEKATLTNLTESNGIYTQITNDPKTYLQFGIWTRLTPTGTRSTILQPTDITENGIKHFVFTKSSGFVYLEFGHNGTSTPGSLILFDCSALKDGVTYVLSLNILNCVQASGKYSWKDVMICTEVDWNVSQQYMPPALPNYELTKLESEDRAALAEVVDSGAKNLWDFANTHLSAATAQITYTKTNTSVTVSSNGATYQHVDFTIPNFPAGTFNLSCLISNLSGTDPKHILVRETDASGTLLLNLEFSANGSINGTFNHNTVGTICIVVYTAYTAGANGYTAANFMICTLDDWKISQNFAHYRMSYQDLCDKKAPALINTTISSGSLDDVSQNTFAIYSDNVSNLPVNQYCYVETFVIDANFALQKAYSSRSGDAYVRVKASGTWTAWKQCTNA